MITMSIVWALIICLFIMNPDSPSDHRTCSLVKMICQNFNHHRHAK